MPKNASIFVATLAGTLFLHEGAEVCHFGSDLFFGTEDMSVILNEAAHTHQAVHRTGRFVTVALAEFSKTHGEVAPAAETRVENLNVAGAVHGLHCHFHVASQRLEHVLVVLVGVAGLDPQSLVATSSPLASARLWANEFARSTRLGR